MWLKKLSNKNHTIALLLCDCIYFGPFLYLIDTQNYSYRDTAVMRVIVEHVWLCEFVSQIGYSRHFLYLLIQTCSAYFPHDSISMKVKIPFFIQHTHTHIYMDRQTNMRYTYNRIICSQISYNYAQIIFLFTMLKIFLQFVSVLSDLSDGDYAKTACSWTWIFFLYVFCMVDIKVCWRTNEEEKKLTGNTVNR